MKFDLQNKIIIGVFCFFALHLMVGSVQAVSVDVGGWNFTADLEGQWQSGPSTPVNDDQPGWDSRNSDYLMAHNMDSESPNYNNWKGVRLSNAFWLQQENANVNPQDLPSSPSKQNGLLANVDIWVHKVPEELRNWDAQAILADNMGPNSSGASHKEIEFNGRPALLVEQDSDQDVVNDAGKVIIPASSIGSIDVLITDDTVVSIDVETLPESDLRAWDVIDSFTISPK